MPTIPTYHKFKLTLTDSISLSDNIDKRDISKNLTDSINLSENFTKKISITLTSENISLSEEFSRQINLSLTETLSLDENFSKNLFLTLSGTLTIGDTTLEASKCVLLRNVQTDVNSILSEWGEDVVLTTQEKTTDAMGGIKEINELTDGSVRVLIQDITAKDREMLGKGIDYKGYAKMFAKAKYNLRNRGSEYTIQPGDMIQSIARNTKYRVETIISENVVGCDRAFIEYIIRRI